MEYGYRPSARLRSERLSSVIRPPSRVPSCPLRRGRLSPLTTAPFPFPSRPIRSSPDKVDDTTPSVEAEQSRAAGADVSARATMRFPLVRFGDTHATPRHARADRRRAGRGEGFGAERILAAGGRDRGLEMGLREGWWWWCSAWVGRGLECRGTRARRRGRTGEENGTDGGSTFTLFVLRSYGADTIRTAPGKSSSARRVLPWSCA